MKFLSGCPVLFAPYGKNESGTPTVQLQFDSVISETNRKSATPNNIKFTSLENHWCPEKLAKKIIYAWINGGLKYQSYVAGMDSLQPNRVIKAISG